MPTFRITSPSGETFEVTAPEGTTEQQALERVRSMSSAPAAPKSAPSKPFGQQVNEVIADVPRQVGLTARYGLEGVGDVLDFASAPIRAGLNAVLPDSMQIPSGSGRYVADSAGLPKPANATERVVGDATRLVAGGALPIAGAKKVADTATGTAKVIAETFAANPLAQTVSAGAAGGAGGYARETGGNEGAQFATSLLASVAAPAALTKGQQLASTVGKRAQQAITPQQTLQQQINIQIQSALEPSGIKFGDLPQSVQNSIRSDVTAALNPNGVLSPDAIRRLADYRLTGLTPNAGTLTLDPALVSQVKNLSKQGINSKDPVAQRLGRIENENNAKIIGNLNDLGAKTTDDAFAAGQKVIGALESRIGGAKSLINQRYEAARTSNGRSALLDPSDFTNQANNFLDDALLGGKLPGDVRNLLNKAATGDMPLTVDVAEQFKTRLGDLQRASTDPAERKALGLVRSALDNTRLLDGQGQEAINAFNRARKLNRAWESIVEKTPALQAVRDGIEPDKFVQQFIIGNGNKANVSDLAMLKRSVKGSPEAMDAIKGQIVAHLKDKALSGASDEVGKVSQSAFNKALNAIGERKLSMFFTNEEINALRANARVASYEQVQPTGAAVNNSNTAGTALSSLLDRVANSPVLSKLPLGSVIANPAQNISVGMQSKQVMNPSQWLTQPAPQLSRPPAGLLMSPAALIGQPEDDQRGLLFP